MPREKCLQFSNIFCISCGTITLDLSAKKVLLIHHHGKDQYLLPKGRKDIGETLEEAALRETFEETGFKCNLLPHGVKTLATKPLLVGSLEGGEVTRDSIESDKGGGLTKEPIAVQQRVVHKALKIIFWFVAQGDSMAMKVEGTQMKGEDFEAFWVDGKDVERMLSFEDDRRIAAKAMEIIFGT